MEEKKEYKSSESSKIQHLKSDLSEGVEIGKTKFGQGFALFILGFFRDALKFLDEEIDNNPSNKTFIFFKGVLLEEMGLYPQAEAMYNQLKDTKRHGLWCFLGDIFLLFPKIFYPKYKRIKECTDLDIERASDLMKISDKYLVPYVDPERAITYYDRATKNDSDGISLSITWNNMGIAYEHIKRIDEAKRCYRNIPSKKLSLILFLPIIVPLLPILILSAYDPMFSVFLLIYPLLFGLGWLTGSKLFREWLLSGKMLVKVLFKTLFL